MALFSKTIVFNLNKSHFLCHLYFILSFFTLPFCLVYLFPSFLFHIQIVLLAFHYVNESEVAKLKTLPSTKKYNEAKISPYI